jgi:SAM-dependent methyltransferase
MADPRPPSATPNPTAETYSLQDNPAMAAWMAARTAASEAAFFLPHLRPGMALLDVGCGPGTITLGLAELVAPGAVVGIDLQATEAAKARTLAAERRARNVRVAVANGYQLPFPAASFDAVFASGVLMHLREPARALAEMRRVLRPRGIIGVRDLDWGIAILTPTTPLLEESRALRMRVRQHNGSDPFLGRQHRRLLLEAGFARTEASVAVESAGSLEETRHRAAWFRDQIRALGRTAVAEGWVTHTTVDAMAAEIEAWAERPDAFSAEIWCAAIGWVGD